jgi:3-hydroxyisobutyrate dehydrogenase-like beta-hydroxyacid dehydrogenase
MKMKFVANLLVAIHNVASAEAMVLGMKAGTRSGADLQADPVRRRQFARVRAARADDGGGPLRRRQPHHAVSTWQKDMKVIGEYAASVGCPTPLFSACEPIYRAAISTGFADQDTGSVCAVLEAMAGIKR